MKFYDYFFCGEALGGEIIVVAKNREQADKLAADRLKERYKKYKDPVKSFELEFGCEWEFDPEGCVAHFWDGDY